MRRGVVFLCAEAGLLAVGFTVEFLTAVLTSGWVWLGISIACFSVGAVFAWLEKRHQDRRREDRRIGSRLAVKLEEVKDWELEDRLRKLERKP